jgi:hypothetical protein
VQKETKTFPDIYKISTENSFQWKTFYYLCKKIKSMKMKKVTEILKSNLLPLLGGLLGAAGGFFTGDLSAAHREVARQPPLNKHFIKR